MASVTITEDDCRLFQATYHIDPRIRQMEAVHRMHILSQRADRELQEGMNDADSDDDDETTALSTHGGATSGPGDATTGSGPRSSKRGRRASLDANLAKMTSTDVTGIASRPEDAGTQSEALVGMQELEHRGGAAMYFYASGGDEHRFRLVHVSAPEGFVERLTRNAHMPMWVASPPARTRRLQMPGMDNGGASASAAGGSSDSGSRSRGLGGRMLKPSIGLDVSPRGGGLMSPLSTGGSRGSHGSRHHDGGHGPVRAMVSPDGSGSLPGVTTGAMRDDGVERTHWQAPPGAGGHRGMPVPGQVELESDQDSGRGGRGAGGRGSTAAATIAAARQAVGGAGGGGEGGEGMAGGRPNRPTPPPRGDPSAASLGTRRGGSQSRNFSITGSLGVRRTVD